jgi:Fe-S cluster biogenesis protein NfuA/nitrite reductase/ring-hydroxylating ferredoxin subunit
MAARRNLPETGDRIERLLEEIHSMASPPAWPAWERVEELLRVVLELYAAGLERVLTIVSDGDGLVRKLADDELVASLLVLHGLHPDELSSRVQKALVRVRPYLGSHGGDVEIVETDARTGVVRLRMKGSCDGCPSSAITVKLAVEGAIRELAPEVNRVEVEGVTETTAEPTAQWVRLETAVTPEPEELAVREVGGARLVLCRVGGQLYAYRDACPACDAALGHARLTGSVLACPACGRRYDVRLAGRSLDERDVHLAPVPLLERETGVEIALEGAPP